MPLNLNALRKTAYGQSGKTPTNLSGGVESRHAENDNRPEAYPVKSGADSHGQPKGSETRGSGSSAPPAQRKSKAAWTAERGQKQQDAPKTAPHSVEAEQGVLGSMLADPKNAIAVARQYTHEAHYYVPAHRTIFTALCDMWDSGVQVDLITFTQFLRDQKQLDAVGGAYFVTQLFTFVPTAAAIQYYLEIVKEKFLRREMIAAGSKLVRQAYVEGEELKDLLGNSSRSLSSMIALNESKTLQDGHHCLNGHRPEMPDELVKHLLHLGSKMIVGGTSKGRKTMALIDLSVSIATGADWWGFRTKRGPICYINFEIQDAFFWYRVAEVCNIKGVSLDEGSFYAWNLRGKANAIEGLTDELISVLRSKPFVLVVIDPIYKALGARDENKAGDVASMLNELEKIAVETGAAIAFGAHYSKGNQALKESIDRIGGSGVFARDPDSILTMTAHEDLDCFTVDATLRNFPPMSPFVLRWDWPLFRRDDEKDPKQLRGKVGSPKLWGDDIVLDQMSIVNGQSAPKLAKYLADQRGLSRATFYRILTKLEDDGKIERRDGDWYRIEKSRQNEPDLGRENSSQNPF